MSVRRFESWLGSAGLAVTVKEFPHGTRTAVDAARAVGCDVGRVVKPLVLLAGARPVVALVSAPNRLDERKLGAVAGEPVTKAEREAARVSTGYAIRGVP